jgi:hypothetical protein
MKLPALRLDKDALGEFLLRHGEKLVGTVVAIGAVLLIWGGIDSIRSRSVRPQELPESIRDEVTRADAHIRSMPRPPDDLLPPHAALAAAVDPWLAAKSEAAPPLSVLDKPLFPEFSRRSQPDVLPVEQLRAVAGIAVFPLQQAAGDAAGRPPAQPPAPDRRGRPGAQRNPGAPGERGFPGPEGFGRPDEGFSAAPAGTPGRIVPYVVVTGLIPVAKQREEYRRRFAEAGYQDARRDAPLWSDFEIEKCIVTNGQDGQWRPIDLAGASRIQMREWSAPQPLPVPTDYVFQATEERRSRETPLGFVGLLPQRIDRPWAAEPIHPWVLEHIRSRPQPTADDPGDMPAAIPEPDAAIFGGPGEQRPDPRDARPPAPGEDAKDQPLPDYRLFAFVDTAVKPNTAYRYRLRLKVWNPNLGLPQQHLVDPAIAKEQRLSSPASSPTAAARVPDPQVLLVDVVPAADVKKLRLKPGVLEVLVLDASADTGNYAIRSVLLDVGGIANVDKKLNRPGETRSRGEDAITDRLLVDVFGQQIEGDDKPRRGPRMIPEPFTAVFLRPDGSFEQVTAADSERLIDRYRDTLPERDAGRRETRPTGPAGEFDIFPGAPGFPGGPGPQQPDSPFPPRR